ncbi:MAG: cache domain-containing protein [Oligoflexales bacterium]
MSALKKKENHDSNDASEMNATVKEGSGDLLGTITQMGRCLDAMNDIIQKANFIALNASIEAARTQTQSENFSLVAQQVRRQAERTEELANGLGMAVEELELYALKAIAVNCTDTASDLIDKLDRNLFERNCDVQAWAGFKENVECARALLNEKDVKAALQPNDPKNAKIVASCQRLKVLVQTYNIYIESMLINNKGIVIATAKDPKLIGRDLGNEEDFITVMTTNKPHVTEMFFDPYLKERTVGYTAPIRDENGNVIGGIANRFNWHFAHDIVEKIPLGKNGKIYVISQDGTVICSSNRQGILIDNLTWLTAGEQALQCKSGYTIECARNGQLAAWGYCHTFGYNSYKGKQWSALIYQPVKIPENKFITETITREVEGKKEAAPETNRNLERIADRIQEHVRSINTINNETNMLAVNAAIQAGVAGAEGEAFSVIASEIGQLARQSEEFVNAINEQTKELSRCVRSTVYTRLGEAAFDTIDKVDRNLYERFCDIQAFASFNEMAGFLKGTIDEKEALELLRKLHEIYEVYHDLLLLDIEGNIRATAKHREIVGQNQGDRSWFRECAAGNVVVTDFYNSKTINDYTVTFAAPVRDTSGAVIGVITSRFNCAYVYDILKATIVGNKAEVFLINSKGLVIGSPTREGILETSFSHLKAFSMLNRNSYGHTLEAESKDGTGHFAFGYAKTQGYINYRGKGWSVVIRQPIEEAETEHLRLVANSKEGD